MVWLPLLNRNRSNTAARNSTDDDRRDTSSPSAGLGRKLVIALGIGALAYLVARRHRREGSLVDRQLNKRREDAASAGDELEGAQKISIDDPSAETDRNGASGEAADGPGTDDDAFQADETTEAVSTTDRSATEIDERAETDIQEEPAEPGEMTIDEDVAEEVVAEEVVDDEDASESGGDGKSRTDTDDVIDAGDDGDEGNEGDEGESTETDS